MHSGAYVGAATLSMHLARRQAADADLHADSSELLPAKQTSARSVPSRVLYLKKNADYDALIQICTKKLAQAPRNIRALLIRASAYLKKGTLQAGIGRRAVDSMCV
jgi:hypothetical protein